MNRCPLTPNLPMWGLTMLFVVDRYPVPPGAPDEVNKPM
jgi:hypothetical protein